MNAALNDKHVPETTTIVHDILETEETTVTPVVEDQEDAAQDDAEDSDTLLLSSTFPPEHLSTLECPSCVCTCPTSAPLTPLVATPYIMDNITTSEHIYFETDTSSAEMLKGFISPQVCCVQPGLNANVV